MIAISALLQKITLKAALPKDGGVRALSWERRQLKTTCHPSNSYVIRKLIVNTVSHVHGQYHRSQDQKQNL